MDIGLDNIDPVALNLAGVERQAGSAQETRLEQAPPRSNQAVRWINWLHNP